MKSIISETNLRKLWLIILLLVLTVPLWILNNDRVIDLDEPRWVIRGANYYYALTHGDFENTYYEYHPGITNMWIVATAMHFYFPEYRGLGQGYFDERKPIFENFMRENGKEPIVLVRNSRLLQSGILATLAVVGFLLLQLLIDQKAAFLSITLATIAPFFLGNSRLLNIEGMLSMFVLVSFLGIQVYLNKERKWGYLLLSGAAFGLAQLSKSSSIVVLGLVGLMLFIGLFKQNEQTLSAKIRDAFRVFLIWLGTAALVYFILWPGMWVAPGRMLANVYGNAFSYVFQGARLDITKELQPSSFSLVTGFGGIIQYATRWITASTLISWLGIIFIPFIFASKDKALTPAPTRSTMTYLAILAALFIGLFGMAQGRDAAHYILSSFVGLDVLAGIGWGYALLWIQKRWKMLNRAYVLPLAFIALIAFQLGGSLLYYPYYFTYKNPFVKQGGLHGYGEGLDQAAAYLAQKPNAKDMRVIAYAARGCFSYFFPGESDLLKIGFSQNGLPYIEGIENANYLVLYTIRQQYKPDSIELMHVLQNVIPEHTIFINDMEYIRIYKIADLPEDIYNILQK
jgi:hypothetical protein